MNFAFQFIVKYRAIGSALRYASTPAHVVKSDASPLQQQDRELDRQPLCRGWLQFRSQSFVSVSILLCSCGVIQSVAQAEPPQTPSVFTEAEIKTYIDAHNVERAEVGAPPAVWDKDVAAYAQAYANHLAQTGEFKHIDREQRKSLDQGENLYWGSRPDRDYQVRRCTESWASEKINPKTNQPVYVAGLTYDEIKERNPGHVLGHYTQVIWRTSKRIGAGIAEIKTGRYKGGYVVVGRYAPRGNRGSRIP